jgi:predicted GNAT family acetyltransferase
MNWDERVTNNVEDQQFEIDHEGKQAVAAYELGRGVITFTHTFVPPALRSQGVASALARVALAYARKEGLKVKPQCLYIERYMQSHPETHDLLIT